MVHQIDAQLVVGQADMHMQPANGEPTPDPLQVVAQILVAAPSGGLLRVPAGEGVGGGGDRGHAVAGGHRRDGAAQSAQIRPRLGEARTSPGRDLDL